MFSIIDCGLNEQYQADYMAPTELEEVCLPIRITVCTHFLETLWYKKLLVWDVWKEVENY